MALDLRNHPVASLYLNVFVLVVQSFVKVSALNALAPTQSEPPFVITQAVVLVIFILIALIAVPLAWKTFLASFILFRMFDIVKPPPVRQLERLPEGTGIVLDDVAAGIYALAMMQLLLHSGLLT